VNVVGALGPDRVSHTRKVGVEIKPSLKVVEGPDLVVVVRVVEAAEQREQLLHLGLPQPVGLGLSEGERAGDCFLRNVRGRDGPSSYAPHGVRPSVRLWSGGVHVSASASARSSATPLVSSRSSKSSTLIHGGESSGERR